MGRPQGDARRLAPGRPPRPRCWAPWSSARASIRARVDDVIVGCVDQVGEQASTSAAAPLLGAGFPETVPATTIDRQCGSSQQAAHFAAQGVMAGAYDIVDRGGRRVDDARADVGQRPRPPRRRTARASASATSWPTTCFIDQGLSGEIDRRALGARRARSSTSSPSPPTGARPQATEEGRFADEIVPIRARATTARSGSRPPTRASAPTPASRRSPALRPVFREDGRLTAGNSSQISDGAAALLIASESAAARLGLRPRARFHSFALAGVDPIESSPARSRAPARCSTGRASRWTTSSSSR